MVPSQTACSALYSRLNFDLLDDIASRMTRLTTMEDILFEIHAEYLEKKMEEINETD